MVNAEVVVGVVRAGVGIVLPSVLLDETLVAVLFGIFSCAEEEHMFEKVGQSGDVGLE